MCLVLHCPCVGGLVLSMVLLGGGVEPFTGEASWEGGGVGVKLGDWRQGLRKEVMACFQFRELVVKSKPGLFYIPLPSVMPATPL